MANETFPRGAYVNWVSRGHELLRLLKEEQALSLILSESNAWVDKCLLALTCWARSPANTDRAEILILVERRHVLWCSMTVLMTMASTSAPAAISESSSPVTSFNIRAPMDGLSQHSVSTCRSRWNIGSQSSNDRQNPASSSASVTGGAPGRVDSPPMSIQSAPRSNISPPGGPGYPAS